MITSTKVLDKEWLDRIHFAYYNVYVKENPSEDIEKFISWLFKNYGYIEPK